jgi:uncharacterized protein DUF1353
MVLAASGGGVITGHELVTHRIFCSYVPSSPRDWRLERSYTRLTSIGELTVPSGFIWDGCSVPRFLWSILPIWGRYSGAALVHDYLYREKPCMRWEADRVFLELLVEDRVPPRRALTMFRAVRTFGARCWIERGH